jgi:hypothetical protein
MPGQPTLLTADKVIPGEGGTLTSNQGRGPASPLKGVLPVGDAPAPDEKHDRDCLRGSSSPSSATLTGRVYRNLVP